MYYIELVSKTGETMVWDYDNRMDFERHLDNAITVFDGGNAYNKFGIVSIRMCICRLWIKVR